MHFVVAGGASILRPRAACDYDQHSRIISSHHHTTSLWSNTPYRPAVPKSPPLTNCSIMLLHRAGWLNGARWPDPRTATIAKYAPAAPPFLHQCDARAPGGRAHEPVRARAQGGEARPCARVLMMMLMMMPFGGLQLIPFLFLFLS